MISLGTSKELKMLVCGAYKSVLENTGQFFTTQSDINHLRLKMFPIVKGIYNNPSSFSLVIYRQHHNNKNYSFEANCIAKIYAVMILNRIRLPFNFLCSLFTSKWRNRACDEPHPVVTPDGYVDNLQQAVNLLLSQHDQNPQKWENENEKKHRMGM